MDTKRLMVALFVGAVLGGMGYVLGQFAPFTGLAQFAEPFSPLRNQTAFAYASIAGVIGLLIGFSAKKE
jgi:hypothetical protein